MISEDKSTSIQDDKTQPSFQIIGTLINLLERSELLSQKLAPNHVLATSFVKLSFPPCLES